MDIETIIFKEDKIIQKPKLETIAFDTTEKDRLIKLYSKVFAGDPWYEQFSCVHCGKTYGTKEGTIDSITQKYYTCNNDKCKKPNVPLKLASTYEGAYYKVEDKRIVNNLGKEILEDALQQECFFGVAAKNNGQYIGFSWGYKLPKERSPSVWFDKVQQRLEDRRINADKVFYAAETGVAPEYQKNGIGGKLIRERLSYAKNMGFESVIFRTVNPKLIEKYEEIFGVGNGVELFRDPDPSKSDNDKWYLWNFKDFKV
ncbi:MAG: GNAT family N-acetyltransferase [Candidatus Woesearchaeota archaeon]